MIKLLTKPNSLDNQPLDYLHDSRVAHAKRRAMEEIMAKEDSKVCDMEEWCDCVRWIEERAAEILRNEFEISQ